MTQVNIAVPTHESLSIEYSVEVAAPEHPDGSPIDGEITAILAGRVGQERSPIQLFVFDSNGSHAVPADEWEDLRNAVTNEMVKRSL